MWWVVFVMALNVAISFWNASLVGRFWSEKHLLPVGTQVLMWAGAIMAVCGFFSTYAVILVVLMASTHMFEVLGQTLFKVTVTPEDVRLIVETTMNMVYLMIIIPILGSGLVIWAHSLAVAYKQRNFSSAVVAGWNTYAQLHNTYNAVRYVPRAGGEVGKSFGKIFKSKDSGKVLAFLFLIFLPLILSLGLAIWTVAAIIQASDVKYDLVAEMSA